MFQLDNDVEPETPVPVVRAKPRFSGQSPLVLRKRFPENVKKAVLGAFKKGVVNEHTGLTIGMSGRDFHKHMDTKGSVDELAHLEAIANLPELMRTARRIETHNDRDPQPKLKNIRRFISVFGDGINDYAVLLTVKEYSPGKYSLDKENPVSLYHHRVEKQLTPAPSAASEVESAPSLTPSSVNSYNIRELLKGVKDSRGRLYFE